MLIYIILKLCQNLNEKKNIKWFIYKYIQDHNLVITMPADFQAPNARPSAYQAFSRHNEHY